jgi:hypothetical protein
VSDCGASTVHNDWIETVESENGDEITRLNERLINGNFLDISHFHIPANSIIQEFNIGLLHVSGNMGGNVFSVGVRTKTTKETEKSFEGRNESINEAITEHVNLEATVLDILQGVLINIGEGNTVYSFLEENFDMIQFSVTDKEPVLAEESFRSLGINSHSNILCVSSSVVVDVILESDLFETHSTIISVRLSLIDKISN